MTEPKRDYANSYYYGEIGDFGGTQQPTRARRYTVIQSLWTKPIKDKDMLRKTLYIAALSLAYAHASGYKVHMHTDSRGAKLLKHFGYERLRTTLNAIPDTVPAELFAAGKFYALRREGALGKVHIDIDVFIKKAGLLDRFYKDKKMDVIFQMEEDMPLINHTRKIMAMHTLGYPSSTRPNWNGSANTGIVGFNNAVLAARYMNNYFEALDMYTQDMFDKFRMENPCADLQFDFILEQINLSCMSVGYNAYALLPTKEPAKVANKIGYQHMQGGWKWSDERQEIIKQYLTNTDKKLFDAAVRAAELLENEG